MSMIFPMDLPSAWIPTINGIDVSIWFSITDIKTGTRVDEKAIPGKPYPLTVDQGYDLVSFKMRLEAYSSDEETVLENLFNQCHPPLSDLGGNGALLSSQTIVTISWPPLSRLGILQYKSRAVSPPQPTEDGQMMFCELEFRQWSNYPVTSGAPQSPPVVLLTPAQAANVVTGGIPSPASGAKLDPNAGIPK